MRSRAELSHLRGLFTEALKLSEARGRDATGVALVKRDGASRMYKKVITASKFIRERKCRDLLAEVDNSTTILMGHTRWATVGDKHKSANAQPILAGAIRGTANGTITNADWLFRRFNLPRHAEVDSEVIFRLADESVGRDGRLNLHTLAARLALCRGSLATVIVAKSDPERVVMVKGNKPLEMMYSLQYKVIFYASDLGYIRQVIGSEHGWFKVTIPGYALIVVDTESLEIADVVPIIREVSSTLCVR